MKVIQKKAFEMILDAAECSGTSPDAARQNMFFLHAGPGLGKTYLLRVLERHLKSGEQDRAAGVRYVTMEQFISELIYAYREGTAEEFRQKYGQLDVLLVDDVEHMEGKEATQEAFLDILEKIHEAGGTVAAAGTRLPEQLAGRDWSVIELEVADVEERKAILREKAKKLGISAEEEILQRIAENFCEDLRTMEASLTRIAAYAELMDRELNMKLAEEVLADMKK